MFKLWLAEYMNSNMRRLGWTYKRTEKETGVPQTTIYSYAQGRVTNPDDDNLNRIAIAFGDDPELIQRARREALDSTTKENQLFAESADKKRMEEFANLMRANMTALLEEYRQGESARQTEIIQHADARVETEKQRFKNRAEEVARQCREELERKDAECDKRIDMMREHCDQRIADAKEHVRAIIDEKSKSEQKTTEQYTRNTTYLKLSVTNLCIAGGILIVTNILFGAYAIFAYTVFDMAEPSRGLHREAYSAGPMIVFLATVLLLLACALMASALLKRRKVSKTPGQSEAETIS